MTENPNQDTNHHRSRVASGAGLAFLGRMGALIEVASVIAFTWLYGASTFGLFATLWAYVKVTTAISDVAMTTALQRFVPKADAEDTNNVVGYALKFSFLTASSFALAGTFAAPYLASFINTAESDASQLITVMQIYVWVLPFWTLVEVGTAAIRARRTFGPEIKVRIFYEQGLRLLSAVVFAVFGLLTYGLFLAHLVSVFLAAILALRLINKHYDLRAILKAPITGPIPKEMFSYGVSVMPANVTKKLFSEFPIMFLNFLLPGAAGAAASGYYAVARKVASALQVIRLTFEYVMAPLAAERDGHGDHKALHDMFAFATRLSVSIALLLGSAIVLARHDILAAMRPEFQAAGGAILILCAGRVLEASTGPATAIVEMLGHKLLPAFNGLMGFLSLLGLGIYLIPDYGVSGAAVAAAAGLNMTALLALMQSAFLFKLWPYDRLTMRPFLWALLLATAMSSLNTTNEGWPAPSGIIAAVVLLIAAVFVFVRYGLSQEDANALGKVGRLMRPKGQ